MNISLKFKHNFTEIENQEEEKKIEMENSISNVKLIIEEKKKKRNCMKENIFPVAKAIISCRTLYTINKIFVHRIVTSMQKKKYVSTRN